MTDSHGPVTDETDVGTSGGDKAVLTHTRWSAPAGNKHFHDNDGHVDVLNITVLADTDHGSTNRYTACGISPQNQIHDQGLVNVDDPCQASDCFGCLLGMSHFTDTLDAIPPQKECGQTTE